MMTEIKRVAIVGLIAVLIVIGSAFALDNQAVNNECVDTANCEQALDCNAADCSPVECDDAAMEECQGMMQQCDGAMKDKC